MGKWTRIVCITIVLFKIVIVCKQSAIVSKRYVQGRLGDQLLTYARAKWLAYKNNLDLYVEYFPYADQLMLWEYDKHYSPYLIKKFSRETLFDCNMVIDHDGDMLYHFDYWSSMPMWHKKVMGDVSRWDGIIDNPIFKSVLREFLRPCKPLVFPVLPKDTITVVLHVRKGGGFDPPLLSKVKLVYADQLYASRFPPDAFYIRALTMLSEMLGDCPLYVHICTDDKHPIAIKETYEQLIGKQNITFTCRETDNAHNKNVLYDLWYMTRFDYLIRPNSSYSRMSQLLGRHKGVIFPHKLKWEGDTLHVKQVVHYHNNTREIIVWEK